MPACVGGKILLKWEVAKPDWFPERYFSALGRLDYGNEPRFLSGGITLFAGNMALQRKIFLELGGFNVDFGKKDGVGLYAEEPELLSRLRKKGYSVFYQPSVLAEHFVPAERATKKCLYRRKYITGRSEALFLHEQRKRGETLFLVKNLLLRPMHMILLVLKYLFHSTTHQPDKALTDMVSIYRDCGYFIQCGRLMLL
jgi:GT2 family glycosyltransferase